MGEGLSAIPDQSEPNRKVAVAGNACKSKQKPLDGGGESALVIDEQKVPVQIGAIASP